MNSCGHHCIQKPAEIKGSLACGFKLSMDWAKERGVIYSIGAWNVGDIKIGQSMKQAHGTWAEEPKPL